MQPTITFAGAPQGPRPAARRRRTALALGAVAALALALTACGGDDGDGDTAAEGSTSSTGESDAYGGGDAGSGGETSSTTAAGAAGGNAVPYEVTAFEYSDVAAPAGGTIEIENSSGAAHTFTSDDDAFPEVGFGADEGGTVQVPGQPGEYPFHCEIHSSMQATLTVQ